MNTASDFGRYETTRLDFVVALLKNLQFWCAVAAYALLIGLGAFLWNWTP